MQSAYIWNRKKKLNHLTLIFVHTLVNAYFTIAKHVNLLLNMCYESPIWRINCIWKVKGGKCGKENSHNQFIIVGKSFDRKNWRKNYYWDCLLLSLFCYGKMAQIVRTICRKRQSTQRAIYMKLHFKCCQLEHEINCAGNEVFFVRKLNGLVSLHSKSAHFARSYKIVKSAT